MYTILFERRFKCDMIILKLNISVRIMIVKNTDFCQDITYFATIIVLCNFLVCNPTPVKQRGSFQYEK